MPSSPLLLLFLLLTPVILRAQAPDETPAETLAKSFFTTTDSTGTFLHWSAPAGHEITLQRSPDLRIWTWGV